MNSLTAGARKRHVYGTAVVTGAVNLTDQQIYMSYEKNRQRHALVCFREKKQGLLPSREGLEVIL